ncbi:MAG: M48 family metallopeptidase, partial [Spirochaetota bacterium]|nr:M48 family metallopeptidase [Spirochaetota bacterium]
THSKWIQDKLDHLEKTKVLRENHPLGENSTLLYRGEKRVLKHNDALNDKELELSDKAIYLNLKILSEADRAQDLIREKLKKWYIQRAREIISERVKHYSQQLKVSFNRISIKNQKTRWGSCSSLKNLNFNWRLVMAPPVILDYIVVHELAHLKELNHSPSFWKMVEECCPDYPQQEKWLKENGQLLTF